MNKMTTTALALAIGFPLTVQAGLYISPAQHSRTTVEHREDASGLVFHRQAPDPKMVRRYDGEELAKLQADESPEDMERRSRPQRPEDSSDAVDIDRPPVRPAQTTEQRDRSERGNERQEVERVELRHQGSRPTAESTESLTGRNVPLSVALEQLVGEEYRIHLDGMVNERLVSWDIEGDDPIAAVTDIADRYPDIFLAVNESTNEISAASSADVAKALLDPDLPVWTAVKGASIQDTVRRWAGNSSKGVQSDQWYKDGEVARTVALTGTMDEALATLLHPHRAIHYHLGERYVGLGPNTRLAEAAANGISVWRVYEEESYKDAMERWITGEGNWSFSWDPALEEAAESYGFDNQAFPGSLEEAMAEVLEERIGNGDSPRTPRARFFHGNSVVRMSLEAL